MIDLENPDQLLIDYKDKDGKVRAESKWFFPNGEFEMRDCEVIGYDHLNEQYRIRWPNGNEKNASRFNLQFKNEDERVLKARKEEAAVHRQTAEILLKY